MPANIKRLTLSRAVTHVILKHSFLHRIVAVFAASAGTRDQNTLGVNGFSDKQLFIEIEFHQRHTLAAAGKRSHFVDVIDKKSTLLRQAGQKCLISAHHLRRQNLHALFIKLNEVLTRLHAHEHVLKAADKTHAFARGNDHPVIRFGNTVPRNRGALFQINKAIDWEPIASSARQVRDRNGVNAARARNHRHLVGGTALKSHAKTVTHLIGHHRGVVPVAGSGAHITLLTDDDGHRFINHRLRHLSAACLFNKRAALVAKFSRVLRDFFGDQIIHELFRTQEPLKRILCLIEFGKFGFNLDSHQTRQLTQANFKNVFNLNFRQREARHQRFFRIIGITDDGDHLIEIEVDQMPAFHDVDALKRLIESELRAAAHRLQAESKPLFENLQEIFLARFTVRAHHHEVHRDVALKARLRQKGVYKLIAIHIFSLRFKNQTRGCFLIAFVAHRIQKREHRRLGLLLLGRKRLFARADLRIGDLTHFI